MGIGSNSKIASISMLEIDVERYNGCLGRQRPGSSGFHCFATGVQIQIESTSNVTNQPRINDPVIQKESLYLGTDSKSRT